MCGRFTSEIPPDLITELFGLPEHPTVSPRYNIAPTQMVPVIRRLPDGVNRLDHLRWGLIPSWADDASIGNRMINARCETVAEKPAFRQAIRYRRCLVLATGFYEWKKEGKRKLPYLIRLKSGSPLVFSGMWDSWKSPTGEVVESCTILTTAANRLVSSLHERMPVILSPDEYGAWLSRESTDPADLVHLYHPYPADLMEMWPVSPGVNTPGNDCADLVLPVPPPLESPLLMLAY